MAGCRIEGCAREATTRGWCTAHYQRWHNTGEVRADVPIGAAPAPAGCEIDDCDAPVYGRQSWCEMHYRRHRRRGETSDQPITATCTVEGCDAPHDARGYCHGHYQRLQRTGDVQAEVPLGERRPPPACPVRACTSPARTEGLCAAHYQRRRRLGDVRTDRLIGQTAAGVRLDGTRRSRGWLSQGYRYVPVEGTERHLTDGRAYEAEHRLVMARRLGRPLMIDESVHHCNGDKLDNRPENLELWSVVQPAGQRAGDKVIWALTILERYAPEHLAMHVDASQMQAE